MGGYYVRAVEGTLHQKDSRRLTLLLWVALAGILCWVYWFQVIRRTAEQGQLLQMQIVQGTADAPYRYRPLVPWMLTIAQQVTGASYTQALLGYSFVCFLVLFLLLHRATGRVWVPLLLGILMPLTLRDHYYQPWSWLEAVLLGWGLMLIRSGSSVGLLALLVGIYALVRETAVFLAIAYWLYYGRTGWKGGSTLLAIWGILFLGLRMVLGHAEWVNTLAEIAQMNLSIKGLVNFLVKGVPLLLPLWATLWVRKYLSESERRLLWLAVPYLGAIAVFGVWKEARLYVPLWGVFSLGLVVWGDSLLERMRAPHKQIA